MQAVTGAVLTDVDEISVVAIVVPYFQREPGVLRKALASVAAQSLPPTLRLSLVVVDDGSPAPAEPEFEGISFGVNTTWRIVSQANGGVAAARQAGLDALEPDVTWVAFLDSDDAWSPQHLANAHQALSLGADFYFSDHERIGHHRSVFEMMDFPPAELVTEPVTGGFAVVEAEALFPVLLRTFAAHLSTVVYRRAAAGRARFDSELQIAGEDRLFALEVLSSCESAAFDTAITATCGEGVNIYYSRLSWADEGHIVRELAEVMANRRLLTMPRLGSAERELLLRRIAEGQRRFAYFVLRWTLRGGNPWTSELKALIRRDPGFRAWFPRSLFAVAVARAFGGYRPGSALPQTESA